VTGVLPGTREPGLEMVGTDRAAANPRLAPGAPLSAVDDAFAPAGTLLWRLGPPGAFPRPAPAPRRPHYAWTRTGFPVPDKAPA
jgi:hypothetical protein